MKNILVLVLLAVLLGSCSNDNETANDDNLIKQICITIEDVEASEMTRASYEVDPTRGFVSTWTEGDIIGIYPIGGDQVAFPISSGEGNSTAKFDGGSWALRSTYTYSAYYPFNKKNYYVSEKKIPVNYKGQSQQGNNSTSGLSAFDYLAAAPTNPDANGTIWLMMNHLGAFVRFQLTVPEDATIVKANVASDSTPFIMEGTVDLTAAVPSITSVATATSFDIELSNISCVENEVVTLYAMVAPVDISANNLIITLTGDDANVYVYKCPGKNFRAGKSYNFTITEISEGTGATITDSGWDTGHKYVDLGLSVNWAMTNVGASSPEEPGLYFAWGETEPKITFGWETYKWCDGTITTINKYCSDSSYGKVDNKDVLDLEDDAAYVNWGVEWRMPTKAEATELLEKCTWTWTIKNGMPGCDVKSKINGNSIFLPAAGLHYNDIFQDEGTYGNYWTSTRHEMLSYDAYRLGLTSDNISVYHYSRDSGRCIRAVHK